MVYFQSVLKKYGMIMTGVVLALVLALGCSTHKTDNMAEDQSQPDPQEETVQAGQDEVPSITGVDVRQAQDSLEIWVAATGKLEYTSIKQSFPFAISVYMPDTRLMPEVEPQVSQDPRISGIRLGYADTDQTTVKLEILLNKDIPYTVQEGETDLVIVLREKVGLAEISDAEPVAMAGSGSAQPDLSGAPMPQAASAAMPSGDSVARMTHIEFDTLESGHSDIRIQTTQPVRYETRQVSDNQMNLILYNTRVPEIHQRPLLTRYFNSAVERILPAPVPGSPQDTQIQIQIRQMVPFRLVQTQSGLHMAFEPSTIVPPEFTQATMDLNPQGGIQPGAAMTAGAINMSSTLEDPFSTQPKVYTGEKIKLDFYDTDIKNVFRILRSVSGLNFAIDKDVQGKVTLTLDDPVPWDQVMDLVLKMNGLGQTMEGNVVRIATLQTLKDEEKALQDALDARKKSLEQKESLAPLVTEYIPINYSDAKADIEPHVSQILTPDRGRVSVDARTNMIIITDTQAKIDQANDLIYRLDTVTPQIMIEARVVEVTKEFSRSLGVNWNLSNASDIVSDFTNDFNVAVNSGFGGGVSGDFSFFRLFGSSVTALNAQLEASEQMGDVRVVSSPRILTLDNKKARIKQGLEYAYLERDDSGGSSVKFKDIDLLLEVTPHVTPDKRIAMTVFLTKNDVQGVTTTGVPTLSTNEAETELLVNDKDTVVIGGVVKTTKTNDKSGVPFLAGIPVLGNLFGTTIKEDNRNELLIFLTPSIVQLEQKRHNLGSRMQ